MQDYAQLINEAHAATEKHGQPIKGKKYLNVAHRVELLRRAYGDDISISTDIVHFGVTKGQPIAVKAIISLDGRVIATGTASEVIGEGMVNSTSALENAETSAVGRALAFLGLHGGEIASLEEMRDKNPNPSAEGLAEAWKEAALQDLSEAELESPARVAEAYADQVRIEATSYKSVKGVNAYLTKKRDILGFIEQHMPEAYSALKSEIALFRQELEAPQEAAE